MTARSSPLPVRCRRFVAAVACAGALAIGAATVELFAAPPPHQWLWLAALTLLSGSFKIKVPSVPATISVSETFIFSCLLLFGPAPAVLIQSLDGLIISLWRRHKPYQVIFNVTEPAISLWIAAQVFLVLTGTEPLAGRQADVMPLVLPLLAFAGAYFLLNSALAAVAVGFEVGTSPWALWRGRFIGLSPNYFAGASAAALLVAATRQVHPAVIGLVFPILVVSYLTFRASMGRSADATDHLHRLNRLYFSTTETLAMAIDAKDQVTHGHIRRVQRAALGLARAMRIEDEPTLKAIEAAALLHDTGKLAVPEHVLNKPGKLTAAEFETMKLHASVGAEILSTVDFPYPVVPIVRHHHENWDGTGYPDGLCGPDIPIGARILSVVDCYDALTSDRPYRPRLPEPEALDIVRQRRGRMYDPEVVDRFLEIHRQIMPADEPEAAGVRSMPMRLRAPEPEEAPTPVCEPGLALPEALVSLLAVARGVTGACGLADAVEAVRRPLSRLVPGDAAVVFFGEEATAELAAAHAYGGGCDALRRLRFPLGQRLSGWVAVNRRPIVNSDAALDLGAVAQSLSPPLTSCLSVPLLRGDDLVGVWTLYSAERIFSQDHGRILEIAAPTLAAMVAAARDIDGHGRDAATGLLTPARVAQVEDRLLAPACRPLAVLRLGVRGLAALVERHGQTAGEEALGRLAEALKRCLRGGDLLLRDGGTSMIAILLRSDAARAAAVAEALLSAAADCGRGDLGLSLTVRIRMSDSVSGEASLAHLLEDDAPGARALSLVVSRSGGAATAAAGPRRSRLRPRCFRG